MKKIVLTSVMIIFLLASCRTPKYASGVGNRIHSSECNFKCKAVK